MSTNYTHRVIRGFPLGDKEYQRGELVASDDWTYQGKIYVEARGWVEPLAPKVVAHYARLTADGIALDSYGEVIEPEISKVEVAATKTPAKKPVAKKAANTKKAASPKKAVAPKKSPAKKAPAKTPAKKAAPIKKAVKKTATKTAEK
jgi:hypothetical protein